MLALWPGVRTNALDAEKDRHVPHFASLPGVYFFSTRDVRPPLSSRTSPTPSAFAFADPDGKAGDLPPARPGRITGRGGHAKRAG